jgi:hypothetical protein
MLTEEPIKGVRKEAKVATSKADFLFTALFMLILSISEFHSTPYIRNYYNLRLFILPERNLTAMQGRMRVTAGLVLVNALLYIFLAYRGNNFLQIDDSLMMKYGLYGSHFARIQHGLRCFCLLDISAFSAQYL